MLMAKEGSTKPEMTLADSYREVLKERDDLLTSLARVRGLLQRQYVLGDESVWRNAFFSALAYSGPSPKDGAHRRGDKIFSRMMELQWEIEHGPLADPPTFPQSSSLVPQGAESAHPGKQNTADKSDLLPTQLPKGDD